MIKSCIVVAYPNLNIFNQSHRAKTKCSVVQRPNPNSYLAEISLKHQTAEGQFKQSTAIPKYLHFFDASALFVDSPWVYHINELSFWASVRLRLCFFVCGLGLVDLQIRILNFRFFSHHSAKNRSGSEWKRMHQKIHPRVAATFT